MKKNKHPKIWISKYRMLFVLNLFSWLITTIGDMVDMIISGYFIGDNAVSAVEIIAPIGTIMLFIATFLFVGISTLFARNLGAFNEKEAHDVAGTGLIASISIGFIIAIFMILFKKTFLGFYASNTVIDILASNYYQCYIPIAIIYPIYWLIYYLVMVDGDMIIVFLSDIVNVIVNLISSIILVKVFGIKGIGYGTLIGILISGITLLIHFAKKNNTIHFSFHMRYKALWESIKISSSTAFLLLYVALTDIIINKVVLSEFGEQYLSVYGVINLILNLTVCLVCSETAAEPFICVNYGEKNDSAVIRVMKTVTKYTLVTNVIFTLITEIIASKIPSLFGIYDEKLIYDTIYAVRVLGLSYLISGFLIEFTTYYSKIEHVVLSNILSAIHMLIGPMIIVVPLAIKIGYNGMIWGFFLVPIITIIIGYVLICLKYGKKSVPYIIEDKNDKIKIIDVDILNGKIKDYTKEIRNFLNENKVSEDLNSKIQKCSKKFLEELKDNDYHKKILADCTIMIEENIIRIIFRDNGKIKKNEMTIKDCDEHLYSITTGFNRNCFIWEMNQHEF